MAGSDLRATAALVLAGLAAVGATEISGIQYLDRGYEQFEAKLRAVGATISRVDCTEEKRPVAVPGATACSV